MDVRSLASVIGEEELSSEDKKYLEFGRLFENRFVSQDPHENRTVEQSLDLGWELLTHLPRESLDRVSGELLDKYYELAKKRLEKGKSSLTDPLHGFGQPAVDGNGDEDGE